MKKISVFFSIIGISVAAAFVLAAVAMFVYHVTFTDNQFITFVKVWGILTIAVAVFGAANTK